MVLYYIVSGKQYYGGCMTNSAKLLKSMRSLARARDWQDYGGWSELNKWGWRRVRIGVSPPQGADLEAFRKLVWNRLKVRISTTNSGSRIYMTGTIEEKTGFIL